MRRLPALATGRKRSGRARRRHRCRGRSRCRAFAGDVLTVLVLAAAASACGDAGVRAGRGQRLHLSRDQTDPAAVRRLHQGDRHQGQRRLRRQRARAAHPDRRRQQPGRRAADGRHQPARGGGARRHHPADQVGRCSIRSWRRATAIPRATGTRVSMRARVVYASKERVKQTALNYEDLAEPGLEGQDLHPLRPALSTTPRCSPPTSSSTARRRPSSGCAG